MKTNEKNEEQDEFLKYYNQYRPSYSRHRDLDTRSLQSGSTVTSGTMNGSLRGDYGHQRPHGYPITRQDYNGSLRGGGMNNYSNNNNNKLLIKSRSLVRDPRLLDLHNTYRRIDQQDSIQPSPHPSISQGHYSDSRFGAGEDSLSRDSGHSSAGTPELAHHPITSINRVNSCPSPSLYKDSTGLSSTYGLRERFTNGGNHSTLDDTQSLYSSFRSAQQSYRTGAGGPDPGDNQSLYSSFGRATQPDSSGGGDETLSVGSLDLHMQNWNRQMGSNNTRSVRNAKRKFDSFSEEEDVSTLSGLDQDQDQDQDQPPASKRPRSPAKQQIKTLQKAGVCWKVLLSVLKLCAVLLLVVFFLVSAMFIFSIVREYQCSQRNKLTINIESLQQTLNKNLFGQAVAQKELVEAVKEFTSQEPSHHSIKPLLVVVLFGWTGTGKTFSSNLVASGFPVPGNVHRIAGASIVHTHPFIQELPSIIQRSCGYSLVILDDLPDNQAAHSKLESFLLALHSTEEGNGNGTMVIITTSQGGHLVNRFLLDQVQETGTITAVNLVQGDTIRKHLDSQNYQFPIISFLHGNSIANKLIPYFPLTRDSIRACIQAEARDTGVTLNTKDLNNIIDQVTFFSQQFPVFSKIGCKKISAKVMLASRLKENMETEL